MTACSTCSAELPAGAKFCAECGTPVASACRNCGSELSPGQKFCPECGTPAIAGATPTTETPTPAGPVAERRVTSVLFGDLVGFTTLSEARDPEEVRELLGRYFDTAREIVARYGGTIEKFIGDAVMAVWGVPTAHEDDAARAVRAGIDLVERISAFGEVVGAPGLAMRVGVVTGEVAVTIGATGQGMVAGDAVNTAARVQAQADPGAVWVDAQTRSLASGAIDFAEAGTHELKGKAEPVELFAVTAVMGTAGGERSSDRVQAPLVGRRRELSVLKEMFHVAAEERRPRLVIVSGDAGVGKTRLGRELQNYIDGLSATVLWHRGRCLAYGDGVGFSALTGAVRGRIGANDDDAEDVMRAKLNRSLEYYVPDDTERGRLFPALANLLGLAGAAGMAREDLFSAWLTWFERLSQREGEPIIWLVDDAHYADDGLLDFIEHLCTVSTVGLLVVLLSRPELLTRRPTLATLRRANLIGLEILSPADIGELLDGLVEGLPPELRDALLDRADGNPLYAIETVRAMHDQGLTVDGPTRRAGAVRIATGVDTTQLAALAAPASLQLLVASRLDLLPARDRSVLAAAAVIGETFTPSALEAVSRLSEDVLADVLRELLGRDLLTMVTDRLSAEEGQYAFVQTVVRTVAYQTQSKRDRLQRHLAVVDHLVPLADGDAALSAVIAQHLRDALAAIGSDDPQRIELAARLRSWLERSAERALAVGVPGDALRAHRDALGLDPSPDDVIRLHLAAAEAALAAGDFDACLEHARPLAQAGSDVPPADRAAAVASLARALSITGRPTEGFAVLAPYLEPGALDELPIRTASRVALQIAISLHLLTRPGAAEWSERTLRLAEDTGDPELIARAVAQCALRVMTDGMPRIGVALLAVAAEYSREHGLTSELGRALLNILAFGLNRDLESGLRAGDEAMTLLEQTGNTMLCWHTAINQAIALVIAGRWDEVSRLRGRPVLQERAPQRGQASVFATEVGLIAVARDEALDLAELDDLGSSDVDEAEPTVDSIYFAACRAVHARALGDSAAVVAACRQCVECAYRFVLLEDDFPHLWAMATSWTLEAGDVAAARELLAFVADVPAPRLNGYLAAQLPRLRAAIEVADPASTAAPESIETDLVGAIELLEAFGALPDRARAQATLGVWLTRQARASDAAPHLAAARETFTHLRATAWLRELDAALSLAAVG